MNGVPFLYVNILAVCCYVLLLTAFLAAKKNSEIWHFIVVLSVFIVWTGASILMRLEIWPGLAFWYYVSIIALFSLGFLIYRFVCSFVHKRYPIRTAVWAAGTLVILVLTGMGLFLAPPTVLYAQGGKLFTYSMTWRIAIPYCFLMGLVISIARVFHEAILEKGSRYPGLKAIIAGCVTVGLGNIIQIIPGNTFPWDTLSGILFAALLAIALYHRRMFTLTLLVSRNVLIMASSIVCIVLISVFIAPIQAFLETFLPSGGSTVTIVLVVLFTLVIALLYFLIKRIVNVAFSAEEQQNKLVIGFSESVTKSLNTDEIAKKLVRTIQTGIHAEGVYICLLKDGAYAARCSSNPLGQLNFSIAKASPCVSYLRRSEGYLIMEEFKATTLYLSMWETEKELFRTLNIGCIVSLSDGDDIVGLVLLTAKERNASYNYVEVSYLGAISSIASIALKNADLYERMYREARIDSLTGVYNYRAFMERIEVDYKQYGADCLSLLDIDIDDFKLYNQLYGTLEGDNMLRSIANIITRAVGESGAVFRTSGKIFSVVLPLWDGRRTSALAGEIRRQVAELNQAPDRAAYKVLTLSVGICVSPLAASSVKELIDNADLATYSAKNGGKDQIVVRQTPSQAKLSLAQRVDAIIEREDAAYESNSSIIYALTAAIDAKDHYTCRHSSNVARYATILAAAIGLSDEEILVVYNAALLHDIGKISIPESILSKTDSLTPAEYDTMKSHVINSIEMIRHLPAMDYLIPAAIGHHERWDGKGYPRGIAGEEIPVPARCLAVADAFDAMTTDRPYRKGLSIEYAAAQLELNAGTQFDPVLAQKFISLIRSGDITLQKSAKPPQGKTPG